MEKRLNASVKEAMRLELFLKRELKLTARQIRQAKFRRDGIQVNGVQRRVTELVEPGDQVSVLLEQEGDDKILPDTAGLDILYEDEDLLIVNKPAGVVVHPSHGHYSDSLLNRAAGYFAGQGKSVKLRAAGRLDKDTSGVVVFAKNQVAAGRLAEQKEQGIFTKEYLALTANGPVPDRGTICACMEKDPDALNKMRISETGMRAVTHYEVVDTFVSPASGKKRYRIRLWLETGRTHQIRLHMSSIGCSLLGDPIYGSREAQCAALPSDVSPISGKPGYEWERLASDEISRTALHAVRCELRQPFRGEHILVEAPMPEDFRLPVKHIF